MQKESFGIIEHLGRLPDHPSTGSNEPRHVEINRVRWYGNDPKIDIRAWNEDHTWCGKGILLSDEEWQLIKDAIMKGDL